MSSGGINLKILLVGDSGVGKTTLLLKYVDNQFSDSHITTIGVEYKDKEIMVKDKKVNLQIWDTSGQERYRSITKNFYRNANGIIFVFDVTKKESFDHLKDWLNDSSEQENDFKKLVVGNKTDLIEKRVINKETMEFFAEKENKNIKSFETSAKDGTNVDKIFQEIAELILANKTDEEINQEFVMRPHSSSSLSKDGQVTDNKKNKCC